MVSLENAKNRFFFGRKNKKSKKKILAKIHETMEQSLGSKKKSLTIKSCAKEGKQGRQAKITQYRKPPSNVGAVSVPILDFFRLIKGFIW